MSTDKPGARNRKIGFRPGVSVKNGKLYAFSESRIVVVKGWPEMAAWTKTRSSFSWTRFRPSINLRNGTIDAVRSRHRFRAPSPFQLTEFPPELLSIIPPCFPKCTEDQEKRNTQASIEREKNLVLDYFENVSSELENVVAPYQNRQWRLYAMAARCPCSGDASFRQRAPETKVRGSWVSGGQSFSLRTLDDPSGFVHHPVIADDSRQ